MKKIESLNELKKTQIIELIRDMGESLESKLIDMWNEEAEML